MASSLALASSQIAAQVTGSDRDVLGFRSPDGVAWGPVTPLHADACDDQREDSRFELVGSSSGLLVLGLDGGPLGFVAQRGSLP